VEKRVASAGQLHVFLGAAPGVGKTHAMLREGQRLAADGIDVLVGLVETHDRADVAELLEGLDRLPARHLEYRGATFEELDLDAILERRPGVVLVDELAHTNAPGTEHDKRWQDVATLLEQGIDVVSTLNVQHLDSVNLEVEAITGFEERETVPDVVVEAASQIELVDVTTAELADRLAAGRIYSPGRTGVARDVSLRPERVDALRGLARRWLVEHRAGPSPRFGGLRRGGVVVASLTGTPDAERVIRSAADLAASRRAALVGVHVREPTGLVEVRPAWLERQRQLLAECDGRYAEVSGIDVVRSVLEFARSEGAVDVVVGATRRSRTDEWLHGPIVSRFAKQAGPIEIHVVPSSSPTPPLARVHRRLPSLRLRVAIPARRRTIGWCIAALLPPIVLLGLLPLRSSLGVAGALFAVLVLVVFAAAVGGRGPALLATALGVLIADFLFTVPYYSLRVNRLLDLAALVAFACAAVVVGTLVDLQARQGVRIAAADAVAESLARLTAEQVGLGAPITAESLGALRRTFDLEGLAVLELQEHGWDVVACAGTRFPRSPSEAHHVVELDAMKRLALGRPLGSDDARLLRAFVTELRLVREAGQLQHLAELTYPRRTAKPAPRVHAH